MQPQALDFAFRFVSGTALLSTLLVLAGCADLPAHPGKLSVLTTSRSQPLAGAECTVQTDAGKWSLTTPGEVMIGKPAGDLHVVCNKEGYRTSELVYRAAGRSGGGSRIGVGVGGGSGGGGIGVSFGMGMPLGGFGSSYSTEVVVDMTAL